MDDSELAAIRARRMAEMQQQQQSRGGGNTGGMGSVGGMGGMMGAGNAGDEEKKSQMEEARRNMLFQILDGSARERLSRISIVKPDKGRAVEDLLLRMAQTGQLRAKVGESQLIDLLGQLNQQSSAASTKIQFNRRRTDSDDDDWD